MFWRKVSLLVKPNKGTITLSLAFWKTATDSRISDLKDETNKKEILNRDRVMA